tara:strand:+ start:96 stop:413 length:318 start_codon:yes stop_codon:yes gene_type:complete
VVTGRGEDCSGIFTERDGMRRLAPNGIHILEDLVVKYITYRSQSILPKASVEEAMEIMTERRFRHFPRITGSRLCGIVSIGDLVNYRIRLSELEASALKGYIATG